MITPMLFISCNKNDYTINENALTIKYNGLINV